MIPINPDILVSMDELAGPLSFRVDLPYARADHPENIFKTALYRPDAGCWLYRDLASVVMLAAQECLERRGWHMVLRDGLRTIEAQAAMVDTPLVRANPDWLDEPRLISSPGQGGHPRAMAIDITLEDESGHPIDMGTPFDWFAQRGQINRAARSFTDLPQDILENRAFLESVMLFAADDLGIRLYPLPQEWWDFRLHPDDSDRFAPLSDHDLPPPMRMMV